VVRADFVLAIMANLRAAQATITLAPNVTIGYLVKKGLPASWSAHRYKRRDQRGSKAASPPWSHPRSRCGDAPWMSARRLATVLRFSRATAVGSEKRPSLERLAPAQTPRKRPVVQPPVQPLQGTTAG
jgi:hypothetical protein